ncbi:MAG TPA: 4-(cytidine 5'-diphospho)-2-C-methyl-D-erythritol kinase [Desulfohalobiaceae bacterium]|nr:4-(cytidine 5'-diphospho)-2-C-methyl-D-erythritol kinase [Desulfohalobiaceae bacterium]
MQKTGTAQRLYAGCKANLYLKVLGIRQDGYHEIESIFYPLQNPYDVLTISDSYPGKGFQLSCSNKDIEGTNNILWHTYTVFGQETGFWPDIQVELEKNIPSGSGLGGGSSNAAVFLRYLWDCFQEQISGPQDPGAILLWSMAQRIGSDVPFFIENKPAWVTGAGERIQTLSFQVGDLSVMVICPDLPISTSSAYKLWDQCLRQTEHRKTLENTLTINKEIGYSNLSLTTALLTNNFEKVLFPWYPQLREIKRKILTCGAASCVMSGSGSSFIALVRTHEVVQGISRWLDKSHIKFFLN